VGGEVSRAEQQPSDLPAAWVQSSLVSQLTATLRMLEELARLEKDPKQWRRIQAVRQQVKATQQSAITLAGRDGK